MCRRAHRTSSASGTQPRTGTTAGGSPMPGPPAMTRAPRPGHAAHKRSRTHPAPAPGPPPGTASPHGSRATGKQGRNPPPARPGSPRPRRRRRNPGPSAGQDQMPVRIYQRQRADDQHDRHSREAAGHPPSRQDPHPIPQHRVCPRWPGVKAQGPSGELDTAGRAHWLR
jgi:hypothetical protein